jgi:hypothetical protein
MNGHVMFSRSAKRAQFYVINDDGSKELRHTIEMRNDTVGPTGSDPYGHLGPCPPGDYLLGEPVAMNTIPYGHWFTPLIDVNNIWPAHEGRNYIGIHGGGSGLPDSFAPEQGWQITEGCCRVQNADNDGIVVPYVQTIKLHGGRITFTVCP